MTRVSREQPFWIVWRPPRRHTAGAAVLACSAMTEKAPASLRERDGNCCMSTTRRAVDLEACPHADLHRKGETKRFAPRRRRPGPTVSPTDAPNRDGRRV